MSSKDLKPMHFRALSELRNGSGKLDKKIVGICKGRKSAKQVLKDLEEKGWIERVGYGKFKLTEHGKQITSGKVSCEDCGRSFTNLNNLTGSMRCSHDNLSRSLQEY